MNTREVNCKQAGGTALDDRQKWGELGTSCCRPGKIQHVQGAQPSILGSHQKEEMIRDPLPSQEPKYRVVGYKDTRDPRVLSTDYQSPGHPTFSLSSCTSSLLPFLQVWPAPWSGAKETRWHTPAQAVFILERKEQDRYIKHRQRHALLRQLRATGTPPLRKASVTNHTSYPLSCFSSL